MNIDDIICATCEQVIPKDLDTDIWHVQGACVVERSTIRYWRSVKSCSRCDTLIPILICKDQKAVWGAYREDSRKLVLSAELDKPLMCAPCWEIRQEEIKSFTWKEYEEITEGSFRG